jgi:hypothetical protein
MSMWQINMPHAARSTIVQSEEHRGGTCTCTLHTHYNPSSLCSKHKCKCKCSAAACANSTLPLPLPFANRRSQGKGVFFFLEATPPQPGRRGFRVWEYGGYRHAPLRSLSLCERTCLCLVVLLFGFMAYVTCVLYSICFRYCYYAAAAGCMVCDVSITREAS